MNFRTKVPIKKNQHHQIDYDSELFLMGSCFSESIGRKFADSGFKVNSNPFGVLFHPLAIENSIIRAINNDTFQYSDLEQIQDLYASLQAHSKFNSTNAKEVLSHLNEALHITKQAIENASHIFLTLGTAWVYRFIPTDTIVANCHKIPQKKFLKELLSIETIVNSLEALLSLISEVNSNATFVFTVSPVRHLKDGFQENNRSKAHLLAAVHEVVEASQKAYYFPSYELLLDELRDYRFFKTDMVHPSQQAVDFVWGSFQEAWLSVDAIDILNEIEMLKRGMEHRPFNPDSQQHQDFLKTLKAKKEELAKKVPHLRF